MRKKILTNEERNRLGMEKILAIQCFRKNRISVRHKKIVQAVLNFKLPNVAESHAVIERKIYLSIKKNTKSVIKLSAFSGNLSVIVG